MSELTQCNYCSLKQIKANARKKRMKVVLLPSSFMGGTDVFVVPRHIPKAEIKRWKDCDAAPPNGDMFYRKYHVAWMMSIGDHCEC